MIEIEGFAKKNRVMVQNQDGDDQALQEFVVLRVDGDRMVLMSVESMDQRREEHDEQVAERQADLDRRAAAKAARDEERQARPVGVDADGNPALEEPAGFEGDPA